MKHKEVLFKSLSLFSSKGKSAIYGALPLSSPTQTFLEPPRKTAKGAPRPRSVHIQQALYYQIRKERATVGSLPYFSFYDILSNMKISEKQIAFIDFLVNCIVNNNWQNFVGSAFPGMVLHEEQIRFLVYSNNINSDKQPRENVLHPGNGWGKTELIAIKHIAHHLVNFFPPPRYALTDYQTLNIAITLDQALLVFDRVVSLIRNGKLAFILQGDPVRFPSPRVRFINGAIMEAKTTKKKAESVEGKEYGYISADEIALERYLEFIRDRILLPRLRRPEWVGNQIDFSATPKGKNAYYRVAQAIKRGGGHVQGGTSYDNPYADSTLWDYLRGVWSAPKVDQSILGKFIDTSEMMFASRVDVLFNNDLTFESVDPAYEYIEAWDLARGRKGLQSDSTVGFRARILDNQAQIVKRWAFQLPWTKKERELINAEAGDIISNSSTEEEIRSAQFLSKARVKIDSTGVGDTLYSMLQDIAEPCDFRGGRKDELLDHAQAVIDSGQIVSPFVPELADEMTTYERDDKNLSTDNIMAFVILCQFLQINRVNYGTL
jgi:hypothetical protein